jgi:hypothetical protein
MSEIDKTQDYDSEPVRYCARCYSLKIKYEEVIDSECCADCGSSDILEAPIEEWEKKYERRYGHKFTVKESDPKKTFIFKLPLEKLKTKVYESPMWKDIIRSVYPSFPGGLGRADSIILFFDTLIKQGRLDELKMILYKRFKY